MAKERLLSYLNTAGEELSRRVFLKFAGLVAAANSAPTSKVEETGVYVEKDCINREDGHCRGQCPCEYFVTDLSP